MVVNSNALAQVYNIKFNSEIDYLNTIFSPVEKNSYCKTILVFKTLWNVLTDFLKFKFINSKVVN